MGNWNSKSNKSRIVPIEKNAKKRIIRTYVSSSESIVEKKVIKKDFSLLDALPSELVENGKALKDFDWLEILETGKNSIVYLTRKKKFFKKYAIKVFALEELIEYGDLDEKILELPPENSKFLESLIPEKDRFRLIRKIKQKYQLTVLDKIKNELKKNVDIFEDFGSTEMNCLETRDFWIELVPFEIEENDFILI